MLTHSRWCCRNAWSSWKIGANSSLDGPGSPAHSMYGKQPDARVVLVDPKGGDEQVRARQSSRGHCSR